MILACAELNRGKFKNPISYEVFVLEPVSPWLILCAITYIFLVKFFRKENISYKKKNKILFILMLID